MDKFVDTVLQPVYNNIKQCSDKYAFFINGMYFTYEQLGRAILLLRSVIGNIKDDNVALVVNDDIETYASIIALWSEGKSYVPLHPNQPINRCQEIMKQVGCSIVLDSSEHSRYDSCINTSNLDYSECPKLDSINEYNENRLSYILFTSGSTGKPKGVMLSRKNLYAFVDSFKKTGINLTSSDRCLQCFDLTFDVAVESFIIPLIAGACIYTIPYNQIKWSYVYGLLEDFKITFGAMAPSMLRYLKPYFDEMHFPEMRYCILTAEASPLNLIEEWSKHIPNADIFNFYGPTEATIYCTYYKFQRSGENKSLNGLISIGKPFSDISAIIINEKGEPLSEYEKGELCIAGDQLTQGYWNDQDKTQKAFFEYKGVSFYHTGDLCFYDNEGDIMYSGRLDSQTKIQGFRVELGEIEYHVQKFLKNKNAVCISYLDDKFNAELGLAIESEPFDTKCLKEYLKLNLPIYMIPNRIIFMDSFPLNINSKTDRRYIKSLF